jgi:hypothetical protein|tara:strand:- start:145 stop:654 length:510 start_codon:yes stop_codon:yes gene_type:complete
MAVKDADGLTVKQREFALQYLASGVAAEAYRKAYDAENMRDKQIRTEASKLLHHPDVTRFVEAEKGRKEQKQSISAAQKRTKLENSLWKIADDEDNALGHRLDAFKLLAKLRSVDAMAADRTEDVSETPTKSDAWDQMQDVLKRAMADPELAPHLAQLVQLNQEDSPKH